MFCKKDVLKTFVNFTGKHLLESLFNKVGPEGLLHYYKKTLRQVFSCEIYEIFENTFFTDHLRTTMTMLYTKALSKNAFEF